MQTEEIQSQLETIRRLVGDPEAAHSLADTLYEEFVRYVASLDEHERADRTGEFAGLPAKARLVLSVEEIEFPRWCA